MNEQGNFEVNPTEDETLSLCSQAVRSELSRGSGIELAVVMGVRLMSHSFQLSQEESQDLSQTMLQQFYGKSPEEIEAELAEDRRRANQTFIESVTRPEVY